MGRRRGFFAEMERHAREGERDARRRHRELEQEARTAARYDRMAQKERELMYARHDVAWFENTMERLTSVHKDASPPISWEDVATSQPLQPPALSTARSVAAEQDLRDYRPGFFARVFGRGAKEQKRLERELQSALDEERSIHAKATAEHAAKVAEWEETVRLAQRVLAREVDAFDEAVEDSGCLDELRQFGCRPSVTWHDADVGIVTMSIKGTDVVPAEVKTLTATGKLSSKKMPKSQFFETYQDFVCGAALRAGREILAVVPVDSVLVNVTASELNAGTGHQEQVTILSVYCVRERMDKINFRRSDASEATKNFVHAMKFSKGKGIGPVVPLDPASPSVRSA